MSPKRTRLPSHRHTNQSGPYYLYTPFTEQAQITLLNLPTQEKIPIIKSDTGTNKLAAALHQDLPRRPVVTEL